jgi:plastocyanin
MGFPHAHPPRALRHEEAFMQSWNSRRALAAAVFGSALLTVAGTAVGAGGKGPAKAKIIIKGDESFKPNAVITNTSRFAPGTVTVRSGATVTMTNNTGDPHSLSIVKASQVPRTVNQLHNCSVCEAILKEHGINLEGPPTNGPPPHLVVNAGAAGFDTPGDSVVIGPKGKGGPVTFKITAKPGTTLHFVCAIHAWMQGRFLVR